MNSPTYYYEDGPPEFFDLFLLLWYYEPHGVIRMKAGETLPVSVTVRIPEDLPEEIHCFRLRPEDIWTDDPVFFLPWVERTVFVDETCMEDC